MDEILSAILTLLGLSRKAFKQGQDKMASDYADAAMVLSEQHDVNVNKIIYELNRKSDLDADSETEVK